MRTRQSFATALAITAMGALVAFGGPHAEALARPGPGDEDSQRGRTTIVRVSDRGGFDWADAGIGAVAGVALSVLGAGLALLVSGRRAERWNYHPAKE